MAVSCVVRVKCRVSLRSALLLVAAAAARPPVYIGRRCVLLLFWRCVHKSQGRASESMIAPTAVEAASVPSDDKNARSPLDGLIDERDFKHIFVLSSSGKPVFTRHGDEQELVTTFGLLQAMASVVQDAGDEISTIQAGNRRIVYFIRGSLYFVSVSSSGEPEAVQSRQLEFIHNQIIFILTTKIHDVLRMNAAKDIRDLLGYDSMKLMHESCRNDITPSCIAFSAVNGFVCAIDLRDEVTAHLKQCIESSGAALGIILYGDMLCSYNTNATLDLELSTDDVLLLTNFVGHSKSLQSQDQNWIPLCFPAFNSRAYLQAYTCNIKFNLPTNSTTKSYSLTLILIATSADSKVFSELHEGRLVLERDILRTDIPQRLLIAVESQQAYLSTYAVPHYCVHFVYIVRPQLSGMTTKSKSGSKKKKSHTATPTLPQPAQCHSLSLCAEKATSDTQSESNR